jgi:hypothetical protein
MDATSLKGFWKSSLTSRTVTERSHYRALQKTRADGCLRPKLKHLIMRQKQMTTPIFTVVKISNVEIEVVHEEGHHFTFPLVIDKNGRRVLSEGGNVSNGELAKHNADYFAFEARHFAETEARKAGKID